MAVVVPSAHAQSSPPPDVFVGYSSARIGGNSSLMLAGSALVTAASEGGLAKAAPSLFNGSGGKGRAARAARLALFDVPVVVYLTGLNHEWGHQARAGEYGISSELSFTGTPWWGPPFRLHATTPMPDDPLARTSTHGGGLEASWRLKDLAESRFLRTDRALLGSAIAAVAAGLDTPVYALVNLGPDGFGDDGRQGDVSTLVLEYARRNRYDQNRPALHAARRNVRWRAALNFADTAMWSEIAGIMIDHVWNGRRDVRIRWLPLGRVDVLPSFRYVVSPIGPEYYLRSHVRAAGIAGTAYWRWSERIAGDSQRGGGLSLTRPPWRHVTPTVTLDVWSHTTRGFGMRAEVAADVNGWPHHRAGLSVAAGVKSAGYLLTYPMDRGAYVTAGLNVRLR
jgi:hypothetical protein